MSDTKVNRHFPTFIRAGRWTHAAARRLIRRTWKPVVALLLLIAVVHATATFILGRRVEAEIAAIRARGEPLTLAEMAPPSVPDDQNAAVVYERLFPSLPARLHDLPDPVLFVLRHYDDRKRKPSPADWRAAEQALARYAPTLARVDEAFARRHFRPDLPYGSQDGDFDRRLLYFARLSVLSRLLALQAAVEAHAGQRGRALRALERLERLGALATAGSGPSAGRWTGYFGLRDASQVLRYVARHVQVAPADARRLYDVLAQVNLVPGHITDLSAGRASALELLSSRAIRYGPRALVPLRTRERPSVPLTRLEGTLWRPLTYYNVWVYLRFMRHAMDTGARPWRGVPAVGFPFDLRGKPWWTNQDMRTILDNVRQALHARTTTETEVAGSRVFLALLAYRDREGRYPQSLAELRSGLRWELPPDPFSGRDFGYRAEGKGFRLYSIGANLRDDNGECDFGPYATRAPKRSYRSPEEPADDIIWRME